MAANKTSKRITITCPNHHKTLSDQLWKLFLNKRGTNLNFHWHGRSIQAHRLIMDVFLSSNKLVQTAADMGRGSQAHRDNRRRRAKVLDVLLEFLYRGTVTIRQDQFNILLDIAKESRFHMLTNALVKWQKDEADARAKQKRAGQQSTVNRAVRPSSDAANCEFEMQAMIDSTHSVIYVSDSEDETKSSPETVVCISEMSSSEAETKSSPESVVYTSEMSNCEAITKSELKSVVCTSEPMICAVENQPTIETVKCASVLSAGTASVEKMPSSEAEAKSVIGSDECPSEMEIGETEMQSKLSRDVKCSSENRNCDAGKPSELNSFEIKRLAEIANCQTSLQSDIHKDTEIPASTSICKIEIDNTVVVNNSKVEKLTFVNCVGEAKSPIKTYNAMCVSNETKVKMPPDVKVVPNIIFKPCYVSLEHLTMPSFVNLNPVMIPEIQPNVETKPDYQSSVLEPINDSKLMHTGVEVAFTSLAGVGKINLDSANCVGIVNSKGESGETLLKFDVKNSFEPDSGIASIRVQPLVVDVETKASSDAEHVEEKVKRVKCLGFQLVNVDTQTAFDVGHFMNVETQTFSDVTNFEEKVHEVAGIKIQPVVDAGTQTVSNVTNFEENVNKVAGIKIQPVVDVATQTSSDAGYIEAGDKGVASIPVVQSAGIDVETQTSTVAEHFKDGGNTNEFAFENNVDDDVSVLATMSIKVEPEDYIESNRIDVGFSEGEENQAEFEFNNHDIPNLGTGSSRNQVMVEDDFESQSVLDAKKSELMIPNNYEFGNTLTNSIGAKLITDCVDTECNIDVDSVINSDNGESWDLQVKKIKLEPAFTVTSPQDGDDLTRLPRKARVSKAKTCNRKSDGTFAAKRSSRRGTKSDLAGNDTDDQTDLRDKVFPICEQSGQRVSLKDLCNATRMYSCKLCDFKLAPPDEKLIVEHLKTEHLMPTRICPFCVLICRAAENLVAHVTRFHPEKQFHMCDVCDYWSNIQSNLEIHKLTHTSLKMQDRQAAWLYSCPFCSVVHGSTKVLVKHVADYHQNCPFFQCSSCRYWSNNRTNLDRHLVSHRKPESIDVITKMSTAGTHKMINSRVSANSPNQTGAEHSDRVTDEVIFVQTLPVTTHKRDNARANSDAAKPSYVEHFNLETKKRKAESLKRSKSDLEMLLQPPDEHSEPFQTDHRTRTETNRDTRQKYSSKNSAKVAKAVKRLNSDASGKRTHLRKSKQNHSAAVTTTQMVTQMANVGSTPPIKAVVCTANTNQLSAASSTSSTNHNVPLPPTVCPCCKVVFVTRTALANHIAQEHADQKLYECNECLYSTTTQECLMLHRQIHNRGPKKKYPCKYRCKICQKAFLQKSLLVSHLQTQHPEVQVDLICDLCQTSVASSAELISHLRRVHKSLVHTCSFCKFISFSADSLAKHVKENHPLKDFLHCMKCNFCTMRKSSMTAHYMRNHNMV